MGFFAPQNSRVREAGVLHRPAPEGRASPHRPREGRTCSRRAGRVLSTPPEGRTCSRRAGRAVTAHGGQVSALNTPGGQDMLPGGQDGPSPLTEGRSVLSTPPEGRTCSRRAGRARIAHGGQVSAQHGPLGLCSGRARAVLEPCSGCTWTVLWPYLGRDLAILGPCSGHCRVVLWPYLDRALAVLGRALAVLGPFSGRTWDVIWLFSDRALAIVGSCSGRTWTVLWPCSGVLWQYLDRSLAVLGT